MAFRNNISYIFLPFSYMGAGNFEKVVNKVPIIVEALFLAIISDVIPRRNINKNIAAEKN